MINRPRGTYDVLPDEARKWQYLEAKLREIIERYGYGEIRTPIFEETGLFSRSIGEATDIVGKEIYTFKDQKGRDLALRPEGTASVVRAYIEASMKPDVLTRLYYYGDMFRYDRPQKGRFRQFKQIGVEAIGSASSSLDAEVISLAMFSLESLGVQGLKLNINSVGCTDCRRLYYNKLKGFISSNNINLCQTCQGRLERNPMRIFDCKEESCQKALSDAPAVTDSLCEGCKTSFEEVKKYLSDLKIPFVVNPRLVRGLDYYTRTAFEVICDKIDSPQQSTVVAGGRYDNLIKELGGPDVPAVGWAMGIERVLLAMEASQAGTESSKKPVFYMAVLGEKAFEKAFRITDDLRKKGFIVQFSALQKSLKAQLREADRLLAKYALILGEDEMNKGIIMLRDMKASSQREVKLTDLERELLKI